jgi:uncharacterized protein YecT (DUF1311 family)
MKNARWIFVAALILAPSLAAHPQEAAGERRHRIDRELAACQAKDPSTAGMIECSTKARKQWDAEMNAAYREVLRYLDATGQRDMRASQRAWLAFRDKEYKAISGVHSRLQGTLWIPVQAGRATAVTRERALTLRSYEASLKEEM